MLPPSMRDVGLANRTLLIKVDEFDDATDIIGECVAKAAEQSARYAAYEKTLPEAKQRALRALKLARLDKSDVDVGRVAPKAAVAPRDLPGVGGAFLARQMLDDAQKRLNDYWNAAR